MTGDEAGPSSAHLALHAGQWQQAHDRFLTRLAEQPTGDDWDGAAQALWWLDDGEACLRARESAYRFHREAGDDAAAARVASTLAYDSLLFGEGAAVAHGWLTRADDLLGSTTEGPEHGWLAARRAEVVLAIHSDPTTAHAVSESARDIGRRTGDTDLVHVGTALSGLAQISAGNPQIGIPQLDSAVAAATTGEVTDPMWMAKIFCWLITACQKTHDLARADEWCRRVEAVCRQRHLDPLLTVCRVQHSSILIARGTWPQAERNLTGVLRATDASLRHTRLDALVQLGELRRRQGRWHEAEELLSQAEFVPAAIVSRALIRLAKGDAGHAWADVHAVLLRTPQDDILERVTLLLPAVRTSLAAGERPAAEAAAEELRATASFVGNTALLGLAAAATATLAQPDDAADEWHHAVHTFHEAHLPFDEAESRLALATVLLETGHATGAAEQVGIAAHDLAGLGASAVLEDAGSLTRRIRTAQGRRNGAGLSDREIEVLGLVAQGLTNQQIATALTLSPHTVHRHVAHILTKLDLPTRSAAAAHAVTHDLLPHTATPPARPRPSPR